MDAASNILNNWTPAHMGMNGTVSVLPTQKQARASKALVRVVCQNREFCISIESGRTRNRNRIYTIAIREKIGKTTYSLMVWTYRNIDGNWVLEDSEYVSYPDWVIPYLSDSYDAAIFRQMERRCINCLDLPEPSLEQLVAIRCKVEEKLKEML